MTQVEAWLQAESGRSPQLDALLAGGYEALRPCLPAPNPATGEDHDGENPRPLRNDAAEAARHPRPSRTAAAESRGCGRRPATAFALGFDVAKEVPP